MVYYLDSSAAAKFVITESESSALDGWAAQSQASFVTSLLTRVELVRFARKYGTSAVAEFGDFWSLLNVVSFSDQIAELRVSWNQFP